MPFIHNNYMVKQISTASSDPTLCNTVLPRTSEAGSLELDSETPRSVDDFPIEVCAAIEDQVFRSRVIWECLAQLLNDPGAGRMPGHVEVQITPAVMSDDEEAILNTEVKCRHGDEVDGGNGFTMVTKERDPPLGRLWISRSLAHPTQHGPFRNAEAQHLQLAVNAKRTPSRVVSDHPEDEVAKFPADTFSSSARSMPRKPLPIQLEASTVPTNDRLRLDEDQHLFPSRPEPSQHHPE